MYSIAPDVRIVDLTHDVEPYSIRNGAGFLHEVTPFFPAETVFLAVIDPGVGGPQRPLVVRSRREQYFVLRDNGLITQIADRDGIEAVREDHQCRLDAREKRILNFSRAGYLLARGGSPCAWGRLGPSWTRSTWPKFATR
jgi:hypothetical protein